MENSFFARYSELAPVFLRIGLASVFGIFGFQKLANPGQSVRETQLLLDNIDISNITALSYYLGVTEILICVALLIGYKTRVPAILAALMMATFFFFNIKAAQSVNPEIFRDLGLIGSAVALFLLGSGSFSVDAWASKKSAPAPEDGPQK